MTKQEMYDRMYMDLAARTAAMSYDQRRKVGCIIVLPNGLLSQGWNGMPSGMTNVCQTEVDGELVTKPEVIHAEANALDKLTNSTLSSTGSTVYVTASPCMSCAIRLHGAKIARLVYRDDYRIRDGLDFLRDRGVLIHKLEM